jgi:hypothetical protein
VVAYLANKEAPFFDAELMRAHESDLTAVELALSEIDVKWRQLLDTLEIGNKDSRPGLTPNGRPRNAVPTKKKNKASAAAAGAAPLSASAARRTKQL